MLGDKMVRGLEVWRFDYMMLRRLDATSATESSWAFRSRNHWSSQNYLWSGNALSYHNEERSLISVDCLSSFHAHYLYWKKNKTSCQNDKWFEARKIRSAFQCTSMLSTVGARPFRVTNVILASSNKCHQQTFSLCMGFFTYQLFWRTKDLKS